MTDRGGTGGRGPEPFVELNEWLANGGTEEEFFDAQPGEDLSADPLWDPIKTIAANCATTTVFRWTE
jgi:hypothetical protein